MSRRNTGVRGPNSALTEFLRTEGITDAFRRRRGPQEPETPAETPSISASVSPTLSPIPVSDSDSDEYTEKKFGEEDVCVDCGNTFYLSVYSRYLRDKKGYLCEECNQELKKKEQAQRKNQLAARKKRKKVASALLDKQKVRLPSLQDVCIKCITANIHDVDALGDIGEANASKISRILSRNRSLTSQTVGLFLQPGLRVLELWDCSNVDSDSFNQIAAYCPQLESLTLFMCGQLHNDNLAYFGTNLRHLRALHLNGPFLISNAAWQAYFSSDSARSLTSFEVRNTHRFDSTTASCMLDTIGPNLTVLKMSRLDGFTDPDVYARLVHVLSDVTHLELSYPSAPHLVTYELMIPLLASLGGSLVELNLDGCTGLTDRFLLEGLGLYCYSLTRLSLRGISSFTDDAACSAFENLRSINTGLISLDLTKCHGLHDKAVYAVFKHSASTLVELSINSLYGLSKEFLMQVFTPDDHVYKKGLRDKGEHVWDYVEFPLLTTADVGFVRNFDDEVLELMSEAAKKLGIVEVFGDNRCTFRVELRRDLMVIGRQEF